MQPKAQPESQLKVSNYDRVSGLLVALLLMVGGTTLLLFITWLTYRLAFPNYAFLVDMVEYGANQGAVSERLEEQR